MAGLFTRPLAFSVVAANQGSLTPAANANVDEAGLVWRSADLSGPYVIIDLGTSASYDTVALIGTNLRASDTVQIRTGSTSTGIGAYAGTAQAAWTGSLPTGSTSKAIYKIGTRSERYLRIDLVASGHPDGWTQVQRIVVGKALALNDGAGVDLGAETGFKDQSISYSGNGWTSFDEYAVLATLKVTVSFIGNSDWRTDWYSFFQTVGNHRAILCVPDDTTPSNWQSEAIFGRITDEITANVIAYDIRKTTLTITALAQ